MKIYPKIAIGGLIIQGNEILLVKRRDEPDRNKWAIPGGKLEFNETLEEGLKREMLEETGLTVEVDKLIGISEIITHDFHYVIMDYRCIPVTGIERAGSDAADLKYFNMNSLGSEVNESTREFVNKMLVSEDMIHIVISHSP
jgi:8-oxo-dGTP diphosphatase